MPLSAEKWGLQVTIAAETHARLQRAQDLLGHQVPPGDIAPVLHRALELLVRDLERRKCAATDKPRKASWSTSASKRERAQRREPRP
jgi:hypothetical protein